MPSLGNRIAEEAQLLAEEKWILEAIAKIKTQRNCLQIERLHLESLSHQVRFNNSNNIIDLPRVSQITKKAPVTFNLSMIQNIAEPKTVEPPTTNPRLLETEAQCNMEQLDLNVNNTEHKDLTNPYNTEGDEEFEEEENGEELLIDMNMFMNGTLG